MRTMIAIGLVAASALLVVYLLAPRRRHTRSGDAIGSGDGSDRADGPADGNGDGGGDGGGD